MGYTISIAFVAVLFTPAMSVISSAQVLYAAKETSSIVFDSSESGAKSDSAGSETTSSSVAGAGLSEYGLAGSGRASLGEASSGLASGAIENARREPTPDACALPEVTANATRPAWDYAASTTQCGVLETDFGFLAQPMGGGVTQRVVVSSLRYGLTPRLDLRWGLTNHVAQGGGDAGSLKGVGDQWLSGRYRFVEQGKTLPALALIYAAKIPTANPAKGFGTGFVDHQFILIASRDVGKSHFDFNAVGTMAGGAHGFDGATQYGLALTRPLTSRLSGILESYGGPQPGTSDRFGAILAGAVYTLRPALVLDSAYTRTYTAGSPQEQVLFGITYAHQSGIGPVPKSRFLSLALGR